MIRLNYIVLILLLLLSSGYSKSQEVFTHDVPFATDSPQSMWGPNGINVGINNTWPLLNPNPLFLPIPPNFSFGSIYTWPGMSFPGVGSWGPYSFGAQLSGSFQFGMGCTFSLQNFTLGQVDVDYPVEVTVSAPTNQSYDQGDQIDVETSYEVQNGWALNSYYPNPGNATLTLSLYTQLQMTMTAAFFQPLGTFSFGSPNINQTDINIVDLDFNILDGDGMDVTFLDIPSLGALNPAIEVDIPDTLYTDMISGDPLGGYGLSGWFTPPHVLTDDTLQVDQDLRACGESQYVHLQLEIFDLLSNLPIPYAGLLDYLSYDLELGPVTISWTIFSAWFQVGIFNKQCFDFEPEIWGTYEFDVPIEYQIIDGTTGANVGPPDVSSIIDVEIGNTIRMKYPCYFVDLEVEPSYRIDGYFTSHTYDSIPLDFCYSAFSFSITWPDQTIIPGWDPICMPGITGWNCGFCDCLPCTSSCAWQIPGFAGLSIYDILAPPPPLGPLFADCFNLASVNYDWVPKETWLLDGFSEYSDYPPFHLLANELGVSSTHTDVLCYGDNTGTIDVSFSAVSPATPYTYQWTNGATIEDLVGLPAGPYELSAFDANGCQLFTGQTIQQPTSPVSLNATLVSQSCNSGSPDGEASLLIQGGTPPYSVSWSNGMTGASVTGLSAGNYTATVTDNNGCVEVIAVEITEPVALGQIGITSDVNCNGGDDGAIAIESFGGTFPLTYSWSNGATTEDLQNISAGDYTLTVTDARNCTNTQTYTIYEPAQAISLSATGVDILCKEDSTGSINLNVSGGTAGYSFMWYNSDGIIIPYQSEDVSGLPADEYTVLVTDNNDCQETLSLTLIEPADGLATTPITVNLTCNANLSGSINPQVSGGTPGYTYLWSNGSSSSSIFNIAAGTYTLLVTDNNGCTYSEEYIVDEPTPLALSTTSNDVLCKGDATGSATVIAEGATPQYTYNWSNGSNEDSAINLIAGNYSVLVTDQNGCSETTSIVINEPMQSLGATFIVTEVDCFGNQNGGIDVTPIGGTSPYYYQWSTSGSVILVDTTEDVSNLPVDTYLLSITDTNGCLLTNSIPVDGPNEPISITGSTTAVNCFNGEDGSIDIVVSGGTPGYSFLWSNGSNSEDISFLSAGNYEVTVTDQNGCTETAIYEVIQPSEPLSAATESFPVTCYDGNDGYITSWSNGGTPPYSYLWSNGDTTENTYNLSSGIYTLEVIDANGCVAFTGGTIDQPFDSIVLDYNLSHISCYGGNNGLIAISASGGTAPLYYNWADSSETLYSYEGDSLSNLYIGDYMIIVTDANGCRIEEWVTLTEPTLLQTSHIEYDVLCYGDSTGLIDVTNWGGTMPYEMNWSNGAVTEDISQLGAGWYYYTLADYHGCTLTDSAEITQPTDIWLYSEVTPLSCVDESDAAISIQSGGGTEPYYYFWTTGSQDDYIYDLSAGNYDVIYMDANGCSDTAEFIIHPVVESCIDIPNTFTPDGDLYNDTWYIEGLELYPNAYVAVFNKWGNMVFRSESNYEPWDGTVNGQPLPSEVYYYVIKINNSLNEEFQGTITIVR